MQQGYFAKFTLETLFYIFYRCLLKQILFTFTMHTCYYNISTELYLIFYCSMPKDEAQLYAANELYAFDHIYPFVLLFLLFGLVSVLFFDNYVHGFLEKVFNLKISSCEWFIKLLYGFSTYHSENSYLFIHVVILKFEIF